MEHVDVIIVGAGLSGIGGACHLKRECPRKSFVILEGREKMGGTWDLFRYPGVRSDSDMYTLGYRFHLALADIDEIGMAGTADLTRECGVRVVAYTWRSTREARGSV